MQWSKLNATQYARDDVSCFCPGRAIYETGVFIHVSFRVHSLDSSFIFRTHK